MNPCWLPMRSETDVADDDELMEWTSTRGASEVEQLVPVKIRNHKVWRDANGGLWRVWVRLEDSDGPTDGYERSTFFGNSLA